jgi:hypothetical protein
MADICLRLVENLRTRLMNGMPGICQQGFSSASQLGLVKQRHANRKRWNPQNGKSTSVLARGGSQQKMHSKSEKMQTVYLTEK